MKGRVKGDTMTLWEGRIKLRVGRVHDSWISGQDKYEVDEGKTRKG